MYLRSLRRLLWPIPSTLRRLRTNLNQGISMILVLAGVILTTGGLLYVETQIMDEPLKTSKDVIKALRNSGLLNALGSVALISSGISFVLYQKNATKNKRINDAYGILDSSQGLKKSFDRNHALQELNQLNQPLKRLSFGVDGVILNNIKLPGMNLDKARMPAVEFEDAILDRVSFTGADLKGGDFQQAKLRVTNFFSASLQNSDFRASSLRDASFRNAELANGNFKGADLRFANFDFADLQGCQFERADIRHADFSKARNIPLDEIRAANGWEKAIFEPNDRRRLENPSAAAAPPTP